MRITNRLLAMLARYAIILLAAFVVFFLIRDPISSYTTNRRLSEQFLKDNGITRDSPPAQNPNQPAVAGNPNAPAAQPQPPPGPPPKRFKPEPPKYAPVEDHFPWLTHAHEAPPVLDNNLPPWPHVPEKTPLIIGFTRNWPLLLQCVSSFIAAGWPASDIYVVENTGTFSANRHRELTLQNPFFLNITALNILGVNVVSTPTYLTFSQLQNFYLHTALQRGWEHFFWSHQDIMVFSDEDVKRKDRDHDWPTDPYATIYERAVGLLRYLNGPEMPPWATHYFAYDAFTLVNRDAYLTAGGWDTEIPYYATDCDMYLRLHWAGFWQPQSDAGLVFDVGMVMDDIGALFRFPGSHASFQGDPIMGKRNIELEGSEGEADTPEMQRELDLRQWVANHGETWTHLVDMASRMQGVKWANNGASRNSWQKRQSGGQGEPFYRDPEGFDAGIQTMTEAGRRVFANKWGHRGCNLIQVGIEGKDAWKLEKDWDVEKEGLGGEGGNWGADWMLGE